MFSHLKPKAFAHNLCLICLACLIFSTLTKSSLAQQLVGNRTFEFCTRSEHCDDSLQCIRPAKTGSFPCPEKAEPRFCICFIPSKFQICTRSDDCPRREACAINPPTGTQFCIGCGAINEPARNFNLVDRNSLKCLSSPTPLPSPSPKSDAPLGRAFDFCSPHLPCHPSYMCLQTQSELECLLQDTFCMCFPNKERPCDNCNEGDVCAYHTLHDRNECASCHIVERDIFRILQPPNTKDCDSILPRPLPNYATSPNGLTLDFCDRNTTCQKPRRCATGDDSPCSTISPGNLACKCLPNVALPCSQSSDCAKGEVCAFIPSRFREKTCVSKGYYETAEAEKSTDEIPELEPPPAGTGLTSDECRYDWDCVSPRRCTHTEDNFGGCAGRDACTCRPLQLQPCKTDDICVRGEQCINFRGAKSEPFCVSENFVSTNRDYVPVDQLVKPAPDIPLAGSGLTADRCRKASDCVKPRVCVHISELGEGCDNRESCFCRRLKPVRCQSSEGCPEGEVCTSLDGSIFSATDCMSRDAFKETTTYSEVKSMPAKSPSKNPGQDIDFEPLSSAAGDDADDFPELVTVEPSGVFTGGAVPTEVNPEIENTSDEPMRSQEPAVTDEPICIDVNALKHMPDKHLVFERARRTSVLCDGQLNCATDGHIVVWKGRAMMMQSYCQAHVTCTRRIMWVNSPRMQHGLRIPSRKEGFEFTAFAARYGTVLEEGVLKRLVHMGL